LLVDVLPLIQRRRLAHSTLYTDQISLLIYIASDSKPESGLKQTPVPIIAGIGIQKIKHLACSECLQNIRMPRSARRQFFRKKDALTRNAGVHEASLKVMSQILVV